MKRMFGKKHGAANEEMALNITAMADIFTILLVFLLKSYAADAVALSPTSGLVLPQAIADQPPLEALKIEISVTAVLVEGQAVTHLVNFEVDKKEFNANGSVSSLTTALERERKRQLLIAKDNPEVKVDARVVVIADQKTPYDTIKAVLASAAVQGFTDFKLAVVQEGT